MQVASCMHARQITCSKLFRDLQSAILDLHLALAQVCAAKAASTPTRMVGQHGPWTRGKHGCLAGRFSWQPLVGHGIAQTLGLPSRAARTAARPWRRVLSPGQPAHTILLFNVQLYHEYAPPKRPVQPHQHMLSRAAL